MSAPVSLALRAPVLGSRIGGLYSLQPQMRLAAAARQQHTPLGGRGTRLLVAAASKGFGQAAQQPKKKREEVRWVVSSSRLVGAGRRAAAAVAATLPASLLRALNPQVTPPSAAQPAGWSGGAWASARSV